MKKIAIVTGATGGLGREFIELMRKESIDEIWAIARNEDKLDNLKKEIGNQIVTISKDLAKREDIESIQTLLRAEKAQIVYLINNAGMGKMGHYDEFSMDEMEQMLDINCRAVITLSYLCIPYMKAGSRILNISSQASFQPNPYLNLYAATKAFVTSYSRALHRELKESGITVTAVCPGWVDTELLKKEWNGRRIKFPGIVEALPVAKKALKDAKRGKDMSVYGAYVKCMQVYSKLMPHRLIMNLWVKSIDRYTNG
ncbi:MAG TPA: SDR family NAD(P)-dependent oxidoreductase [Lachnospiraceae bacterium]|nr:SDR family NAD(P)-dependent oxidoreductase [Lachnospiraceae bacterium]